MPRDTKYDRMYATIAKPIACETYDLHLIKAIDGRMLYHLLVRAKVKGGLLSAEVDYNEHRVH